MPPSPSYKALTFWQKLLRVKRMMLYCALFNLALLMPQMINLYTEIMYSRRLSMIIMLLVISAINILGAAVVLRGAFISLKYKMLADYKSGLHEKIAQIILAGLPEMTDEKFKELRDLFYDVGLIMPYPLYEKIYSYLEQKKNQPQPTLEQREQIKAGAAAIHAKYPWIKQQVDAQAQSQFNNAKNILVGIAGTNADAIHFDINFNMATQLLEQYLQLNGIQNTPATHQIAEHIIEYMDGLDDFDEEQD